MTARVCERERERERERENERNTPDRRGQSSQRNGIRGRLADTRLVIACVRMGETERERETEREKKGRKEGRDFLLQFSPSLSRFRRSCVSRSASKSSSPYIAVLLLRILTNKY